MFFFRFLFLFPFLSLTTLNHPHALIGYFCCCCCYCRSITWPFYLSKTFGIHTNRTGKGHARHVLKIPFSIIVLFLFPLFALSFRLRKIFVDSYVTGDKNTSTAHISSQYYVFSFQFYLSKMGEKKKKQQQNCCCFARSFSILLVYIFKYFSHHFTLFFFVLLS